MNDKKEMNKKSYFSENQNEIKVGLVKWFDAEKGLGLIGTPDEGDFFYIKIE